MAVAGARTEAERGNPIVQGDAVVADEVEEVLAGGGVFDIAAEGGTAVIPIRATLPVETAGEDVNEVRSAAVFPVFRASSTVSSDMET